MKKIFEVKPGHGWFDGYFKQTDVISTIDSGMAKWHILIGELFDNTNELIERERERESSYCGQYEDGLHDGE